LVDHARTGEANGTLLLARRMGRYDHAARHAFRANRHSWTVTEATGDLAFRALLELIRGEVQARLDERMIEDGVLLAAGNIREAGQVGEDRPRAVLAKDMEQGAFRQELVRARQ
jgi:hypothetical protein